MAVVSTRVSIGGKTECTEVSPIVSVHANSVLTRIVVSVPDSDQPLIKESAFGSFISLKSSQRAYRNDRPLMGIQKGTSTSAFGVLCDVNPYFYTTMGVKVYEITLVVAGAVYCTHMALPNVTELRMKSPSQKDGWTTLTMKAVL